MSTQLRKSNFKVKAGIVRTVEGIVPEKGGIIFDDQAGAIKVGDGANWRPLPFGDLSAVSVGLETPSEQILIADTPVTPYTFFDKVVYTEGTDIVPSIPAQSMTFSAAMLADWNTQLRISFSKRKAILSFEALLNGILISTRVVPTDKDDTLVTVDWSSRANYAPGDVLTLAVSSDIDGTLTLNSLLAGVQQVL